MSACVVSIGDELLRGVSTDTNSAWLASRLLEMGYRTGTFNCLPDDKATIARKLKQLANEFSIIIVSGGLGPTMDDVTRDAAAEAFYAPLELRPEVVDDIRRQFVSRGLDMPPRNRRQAEVPKGAEVMRNPIGTACGFYFPRGDKAVFFMPGVPREMKKMFDESVAPLLLEWKEGQKERQRVVTKKLAVYGIGESALEERLGDLSSTKTNPALGYSCSPGLNTIHIIAEGEHAEELADEMERKVRAIVGRNIVGKSGETPAEAVVNRAFKKQWNIAIIDLATGGYLVSELTKAMVGEQERVLAGAEVYSPSEVNLEWGDELRKRAQNVLNERAADVALVVFHNAEEEKAPIALATDKRTRMSEVPLLRGRRDLRQRITNYALAELWAFIEA